MTDQEISDNPFPCERGCGACCRRAHALGSFFPLKSNGRDCFYLEENGDCRIYDERPEICRVDVMIDKVHTSNNRQAWVDLTIGVCNQFRKEDGMGPLLVQIGG